MCDANALIARGEEDVARVHLVWVGKTQLEARGGETFFIAMLRNADPLYRANKTCATRKSTVPRVAQAAKLHLCSNMA